MQTDGMEVGIGPFYQVGPVPCENCPFYNYLLPYNYPYVETALGFQSALNLLFRS